MGLYGKRGRGARFEVVRYLAFNSSEGGWAGIKNCGQGGVVMVKTINICVRLSVLAQ